ncbi:MULTISPECIES: 4-hydroxyphenylacetate 3-hydroxylase N-terminal domain-containing protein [Pseudomonas]|uniref:4-hydroxyphenylacetate 3-hydroxylase N-terminal domain-containing protein n=1 Tax=Pseudomonas TaxID=286 RepID=UPI0013750840|nr:MULTISPECIES: 4-hydroxyphenylacetate 3-hydroxylase N-terminal domain-containing protein [Pseudomonas]NCE86325.1 Pyoverdin chromophore biosynthetic protein pvcC [Pseudomonas sp. Q1]UOK40559.1 Pyoverdin chromophore biosynthetic protein pvcC [Pseudomonas palleroniana]
MIHDPHRLSPAPAATDRPFTGEGYLRSLQDDRCVYLNGERVVDVTQHSAFRQAARSVAMLYDALHDPVQQSVLTCPTDTGNGGFTHRSFLHCADAGQLIAQQKAIAAWSRLNYGWMGRTPDYKACFMNTLGINASYYGSFADNARNWYQRTQEQALFISHAIANPPVDRACPEQTGDVYIHVEEEVDGGLIISGAKVVATSAALSQYAFVSHHAGINSKNVMFLVPMNTSGIKVICRSSYEWQSASNLTPFDAPLSSRFDENDAILVFDRVFVPWSAVLHYGPQGLSERFPTDSGILQGTCFQACIRLSVKLDFFVGLLTKVLHATSGDAFRGNQVLLGEVIALRHLFWSLANTMAREPDRWLDGAVLPNLHAALAYRAMAPDAYGRVKEIINKIVASALIYLPSSAKDFANPEIDAYLARYVRGSNGTGHRERIKLLKLLWDCVGTEFAGRHELYERNYAGNHEEIKLHLQLMAKQEGSLSAMTQMVERCLADYDENGWINPVWRNSNEPVR